MFTIEGKYATAKVFIDEMEEGAIGDVIKLLNQEFVKGATVRIMPDVHKGKGCVIGFTANLGDKVIPNITGVDIGCGMLTVQLDQHIDLGYLDYVVNEKVPSGFSTHKNSIVRWDHEQLLCHKELKNHSRFAKSIGTLGGGNHFIELGVGETGTYLVIHSGSRNLGSQVATHYQKLAIDTLSGISKPDRTALIKQYKDTGRQKEIKDMLANLTARKLTVPKELCYLEGQNREDYLHDMKLCQEYASLNRLVMADIILQGLGIGDVDNYPWFETTHNYVNFNDNIIRKGAISAYAGETILIPINMKEGSLLAVGKGNADWNYSAPHGAGRIMSRSKAKELLNLSDFENEMKGIFTTSVRQSTLDEAPGAYKPIEAILDNIGDTADVIDIIRPIYSFKAH